MVATDPAARRGVLFKEAKSLELASQIQAIVFDKTGTLTEGKPRITDVVAEGVGEDELLRLTAAAEVRSSHPLAQSILDELERRRLVNELDVHDFENIAGYGIRAGVANHEVLVGAQRLLDRFSVQLGPLPATADQLLSEGKTLVLVAIDGRAAGLLAAADTVRPNAARAIAELKALAIEPGHG
jgi:P-type Cu2+ transporter